jgi:hypothetical protein
VTLPVVGITAGTNVTVSEAAGVYTINSSGGGGGGISGITNYIPKFNSSTTIDTSGLYWSTSGNLGIGTASPTSRLDIKGTAATDSTVRIGPELLTTGTGAGWTGTSFATGYTHSTGTTALAANGLTITAGTYYMVTVTVTGRSAGTCTATVGGLTTGSINTNTTITVEGFATTTANFSVATTSTFNGTVTASLSVRLMPMPIIQIDNASGNKITEWRASGGINNLVIGLNSAPYLVPSASNSGWYNTIFGQNTATKATTAYGNTIAGSSAANSLTTGWNNILFGVNSGSLITSGFRNIMLTTAAGVVTTGGGNIIIGALASASTATVNNEILISGVLAGAPTSGLGSNTTYIGSAATTKTVLAGSLVMGSTSASASARTHTIGSGNVSGTYSFWATNSTNSATEPGLCVADDLKVGIRTNSIDSGAALEIDGTTGGVLFPRLTAAQRGALTPVNGLVIYNSDTNKLQVYAGGAWVDLH